MSEHANQPAPARAGERSRSRGCGTILSLGPDGSARGDAERDSAVVGVGSLRGRPVRWLRDIGQALGIDNRRHAYLALRGTLHAIRDFLSLET
ncbi:MAG TPA: hypothetical protein VH475_11965 [Tepidisphaeraceae bacterium]